MTFVLQASACHQNRKVFITVSGAVTHTTSHNHEGIIKDLGFLQTVKQMVDLGKNIVFCNL